MEDKFFDIWEKMKVTPGMIAKSELLAELADSDFGKFVLKMTYDPFITFGLTPPGEVDRGLGRPKGMPLTESLIKPLLTKLSTRKLTGLAAMREVSDVMAFLTPIGEKILFAILSKDLKCGIASSSINQVIPGLIPVFSVMRAHSYDAKRVKKWPVVGEPKLDGYRTTFRSRNGNGGFFSRSGNRWPAMDFMVPIVMEAAKRAFIGTQNLELKAILADNGANFVLDGEALMGLFANAGKLKGKSEQAEDAELHIFDIMSGADFDAIGTVGSAYIDRRKMVEEFKSWVNVSEIQITPRYFLNNDDQVQEYFDKFLNRTLASYLARGDATREAELLLTTIDKATGKPKTLEGMIVKQTDWAYDKKKSYGWMKGWSMITRMVILIPWLAL